VRYGVTFARLEYVACLAISFLVVPLFCALQIMPWWAMLTWFAIPLAVKNVRALLTQSGKPLNAVLAGTGQLALVYALLFLVAVIITTLV